MLHDNDRSYVACPCGFRAEGTPKEALAGYRTHECALHKAEHTGSEWVSLIGWITLLMFVSFICTNGWGLGLW